MEQAHLENRAKNIVNLAESVKGAVKRMTEMRDYLSKNTVFTLDTTGTAESYKEAYDNHARLRTLLDTSLYDYSNELPEGLVWAAKDLGRRIFLGYNASVTGAYYLGFKDKHPILEFEERN